MKAVIKYEKKNYSGVTKNFFQMLEFILTILQNVQLTPISLYI